MLDDITPKFKETKRFSSVPNILKLASALRFFAEGAYQKGVGNDFNLGIAQPTFSLIFKEIIEILETHVCSKWILFDYSEEDKKAAKIYFYEKCRLPGVIGCIDGTHIRIINPGEQTQHLFYNRKGFHSINAMLVSKLKLFSKDICIIVYFFIFSNLKGLRPQNEIPIRKCKAPRSVTRFYDLECIRLKRNNGRHEGKRR